MQGRKATQVEEIQAVLVFGGEVVADLGGEVNHLAIRHERCKLALAQLFRLPDFAIVRIPRHGCASAAVQRLVLKDDHRIVVLVSGEQRVERILRRTRVDRLESRDREKHRLQLLRVKRPEREIAAAREAKHERTRRARPESKRRRIERDLRHRLGREIRKLKLLDRPVAVDREPDRVAGTRALGQRSVEDPAAAKLAQQILGDLERAAVRADILPEDQRLWALGENLVDRPVERLRHRQLCRRRNCGFGF